MEARYPVGHKQFISYMVTLLSTTSLISPICVGCSQDVLVNDELGPIISVVGANMAFGELGVGCESDPLDFTVGNIGDQELRFNVGAINSLVPEFEFAGEDGPGDHALAPGGEMDFQVIFVPVDEGESSGSIRIEPTNMADSGLSRTIDLSGTGTGDEDGDGWAEECGDPDDTDPDVYPGEE